MPKLVRIGEPFACTERRSDPLPIWAGRQETPNAGRDCEAVRGELPEGRADRNGGPDLAASTRTQPGSIPRILIPRYWTNYADYPRLKRSMPVITCG